MFEFDVKEIEKKLEEEYPLSTSNKTLAKSILQYHSALHDVIEHWLKGEYLNFEYEGISLKEIVEETNVPFPQALSQINLILNHPEYIPGFKKFGLNIYKRDFVGSKNIKSVVQKRRSYQWL